MPWKKGQSGNPKGRAKTGYTFAELSREFLDKNAEGYEQIENKRLLIRAMFAYALKKDAAFAKLLLQYAYGNPPEKIELEQKVSEQKQLADAELKKLDAEFIAFLKSRAGKNPTPHQA